MFSVQMNAVPNYPDSMRQLGIELVASVLWIRIHNQNAMALLTLKNFVILDISIMKFAHKSSFFILNVGKTEGLSFFSVCLQLYKERWLMIFFAYVAYLTFYNSFLLVGLNSNKNLPQMQTICHTFSEY